MGPGATGTVDQENVVLHTVRGPSIQGKVGTEFNRLMLRTALVAQEIAAALDPIIAQHQAMGE
jgi:hypothetical protein